MFTKYFCLDCENNVIDVELFDNKEVCPACGSKNIVEDSGSIFNEDWNGHYEGDMPVREHNNDMGDE